MTTARLILPKFVPLKCLRDWLLKASPYAATFAERLDRSEFNTGSVSKAFLLAFCDEFEIRKISIADLAEFDKTGKYADELRKKGIDTATTATNGGGSFTEAVERKKAETKPEQPVQPVAKGDGLDQLRDLLGVNSVDPAVIRDIIKAEMANLNVLKIEYKRPDFTTWSSGDKHVHKTFAKLLKVSTARQTDGFAVNTWIPGPTGSGKTHAAADIAKALDLPFFAADASTMPHEVVGFVDANGVYQPTPVTLAFQAEKGAVLLLDECDAYSNEALLKLNGILANGQFRLPDGTLVKRHENLIILAGANTFGLGPDADFVGRAKLDAAFLSRFPVVIQWDYDEELERKISGNVDWTKEVQKAREAAQKAGLKVVIDTRHAIAGAALLAADVPVHEVRDLTYMARMTSDQKAIIGRAI